MPIRPELKERLVKASRRGTGLKPAWDPSGDGSRWIWVRVSSSGNGQVRCEEVRPCNDEEKNALLQMRNSGEVYCRRAPGCAIVCL